MSTFSVRWVYRQVKYKGTPLEAGQKPALCFRGRKHALCVTAGHPVRVLKRPVAEFDRYRAVMVERPGVAETGKGAEGASGYPVERAVRQLREIGSRNGITAAASRLLDRAVLDQEVDEDSFNDEEEMDMKKEETTAGEPGAGVTATKATKEKSVGTKDKKAAKPAKGKTKGPAKKSGDGLGREGTLSRFINERLVKGQDNATISAAAKKAFPKASSTEPSHVSWFRWKLSDSGLLKAKA